ncbi:Cytochrome P450 71A26 [Dichanthelium oligosanthes]|uniref:Cytochrome P450 71A26 n=1 Tax=Dichanthelium oligosanthes TaxID=888268 RepID=A0A1E5UXN1_9POAL|nr:Cytochrome P450 71A26 [Dichanthelium oligosanthes]
MDDGGCLRGLPVLGHLHLLASMPHLALRSLARAHGPVMLLRLGRVPAVVVSSAAGAEEVMRTRDLAFASRPRSAMAERFLYGPDVAFAPYGEYWRICVVQLLSARRTLSFRRVREQEATALAERVRDKAGAPFDLSELLTEYANDVVSRAAFGDESARGLFDGGDRGREQIRKVFTDFEKLIGTEPVGELLPWLGWVDAVRGLEGKIKRTFEALDGLLDKVIDDRRRRLPPNGDDGNAHHRDFVDVLLDVHKHGKESGIQLETNEIKAIILDMFSGGTDTTSTVMEWAMAELVTHPRAMRKVQDEIRAAVGSTGSVDEGHVAQLHYLKAVVKETPRH